MAKITTKKKAVQGEPFGKFMAQVLDKGAGVEAEGPQAPVAFKSADDLYVRAQQWHDQLDETEIAMAYVTCHKPDSFYATRIGRHRAVELRFGVGMERVSRSEPESESELELRKLLTYALGQLAEALRDCNDAGRELVGKHLAILPTHCEDKTAAATVARVVTMTARMWKS